LIDSISTHGFRCSMVLPNDLSKTDDAVRDQLTFWVNELEAPLRRLGNVFFPPQVLDAFRDAGVEHVVLCIDPLFPRLPYWALIGDRGAIVDEPWTLSMVTASTELLRLLARANRVAEFQSYCWFGPDADVNRNRGGDAELHEMVKLASVVDRAENGATLEAILASLASGHWCHFRGHGRWTGFVQSSGLVMANDIVLCSDRYEKNMECPGFLFTAACLTGFGEAVGVESFGSLVDYDRAGLLGAVLTNWPIHGNAATVYTSLFYGELRRTNDSAVALKFASQECRRRFPHPYLWAPFKLLGGWAVGNLIRRR
jgi:hypothetical protein